MKQSMLLILIVVAATVFSTLTSSNRNPTSRGMEIISYNGAAARDQETCWRHQTRDGYDCH